MTTCLTIVANLIVFVGTMWLVLWWLLVRALRRIKP